MKATLPQILLVEDSSDDERLTLRGISRSAVPCFVTVCRDGAEAIEYLRRPTAAPKMVVLDYNLPKQDGLDVLLCVRSLEATRRVPVVLFSGSDPSATHPKCYEAGASSCVTKPTDPVEYVQSVVEFTRWWMGVKTACADSFPPPSHLLRDKLSSDESRLSPGRELQLVR